MTSGNNIHNSKKERELAHDRSILDNHDKVWGRAGKVGALRLQKRAKMISDFGSPDKTKKILEIGCGTGNLTKFLAAFGADISAVDIFPEFLEIARKKVKPAEVGFYVADAEMLENFKNDTFDMVCGLSVLHHLDVKKTANNMFRVLKKGGVIAFSEPNMLNPQVAVQKNIPAVKKWLGDSPDETAFFKWQIKKDLADVGFSDISVTPFDFLHPSTPESIYVFVEKLGEIFEQTPILKEFAGSLFITAKKK